MMGLLMEPMSDSFQTFIECYFEIWSVFATTFMTGLMLHHRQDRRMQRAIPRHLLAEYRLLHLQADDSLAEVRTRYRELAKRYHPDSGGSHADFLALQQAYEQVLEYLQTHS
jgi:DnaJ-class molecular chaperone